jgi:hypothetical protein
VLSRRKASIQHPTTCWIHVFSAGETGVEMVVVDEDEWEKWRDRSVDYHSCCTVTHDFIDNNNIIYLYDQSLKPTVG